ncbi:hypothetical protein [Streptomyces sp. NPDC093109]
MPQSRAFRIHGTSGLGSPSFSGTVFTAPKWAVMSAVIVVRPRFP